MAAANPMVVFGLGNKSCRPTIVNPIRHDKRFFPNPSNTVDKKASRMENGKPSCSTSGLWAGNERV